MHKSQGIYVTPPGRMANLLAIAVALLLVNHAEVKADNAIGISCGQMDTVEILKNSKHAKDLVKRLQEEFSEQKAALEKKKTEVQELQTEYFNNVKNLSKDERDMKEKYLEEKKEDLNVLGDEYLNDLNRRKSEEMDKFKVIMREIIISLVENNSVGGVIDTENNPIYYPTGRKVSCVEIVPFTQMIIDEMNAQFEKGDNET